MSTTDNLNPYTFYFELPLYTRIHTDGEFDDKLIALLNFSGTIDAYNPTLRENTTFKVNGWRPNGGGFLQQYGGYSYCILTCVRTQEDFYVSVHYDKETSEIQKIGQYPSIAALHISQIRQYDKVLSKEKLKEFTRAIGLAANGVGIGSFIYLRRIFEDLIEEAHAAAKTTNGWDEDNYSKQRMAEKIGILKNQLPEFLVKNKSLYSILSVGVHSLTEQDCLDHYETVRVGIELILDEKLEAYNKKKKIEDANNRISLLTGKLQSPKSPNK